MKLQLPIAILALSGLLLIAHSAFAKAITLYDQPNKDAKIVGTLDSDAGIISIYSPKGDWIKVADPRNGNVGWIKSYDLNNVGNSASGFTFTQSIVNDKGPGTYQILEFGSPTQKLTPEQTQELAKQMQMRQQMIQKDMQKMMQDLFQNTWTMQPNFPVLVPIIVVPQPVQSNKNVSKSMPQTVIAPPITKTNTSTSSTTQPTTNTKP